MLHGGLIPQRTYLVRGGPGAGKTAMGLHFLVEGVERGERTLFLAQGAPREVILQDAASIGLDATGVDFIDFTPGPTEFSDAAAYDIFSPAEAERATLVAQIAEQVRELAPQRVFLDALTQLRHLSESLVGFRREAHAFLRYLVDQGATVVFASGSSDLRSDEDLQFMSDGVLNLEHTGAGGRTLVVSKMRGTSFRLGRHSVKITDRGFCLFPRLQPEAHRRAFVDELIPSGIGELDTMLNGGIERGTVTLISGPTGAGKSTLGTQFMREAATRGERSVLYTFEEPEAILTARCEAVGIHVGDMVARGTLSIVQIEPLDLTADEFALRVREEVEQRGARIVMLDSLAGFRLSLRSDDLVPQLHALCAYLKNMGVTVIVVYESAAITGDFQITEIGMSYLADNILFLRYVELDGELRRVVGVLKKRLSDFEKKLRELTIGRAGIAVGPPLVGFRGVLSGLPARDGNGTAPT